jgi:hypothetical protein
MTSGSETNEMITAKNINARFVQHRENVVSTNEPSTTANGPQDNTFAVDEISSHHCNSVNSGIERQTEKKHKNM